MKYPTNGAIVWDGPSRIDGSPIMAIVTGLRTASANPKTGDMLQTWILRSDMHPQDAIKAGSDYGICGSCIHRCDPLTGIRTCYVLPFAFNSVYDGFKRGIYPRVAPATLRPYLAGKPFGSDRMATRQRFRLAYGVPCAMAHRVIPAIPTNGGALVLTMARTFSWRHAIMSATEPMQAPPDGERLPFYPLALPFRLATYDALHRRRLAR
jgi:hypothetical protein